METCAVCGAPVSYETGWCREGDLNSSESYLYCLICRPPRGYTLADLEAMKAENAELHRLNSELRILEEGGIEALNAVCPPNGPPYIIGRDLHLGPG